LSEISLYPFAEINGEWNLPDSFLRAVYEQANIDGLIKTVFWRDSVTDGHDFVRHCKAPGNLMVFVFQDGVMAGFAWLTNITENFAFGHFCFLRSSWGKTTVQAANQIMDYWFSLSADGVPIIDTIIGMVPGFNEFAQKFTQKIGFTHLGRIPQMLSNASGERADAVIYFKSRLGNG